jgi:hypothetical protein
MREVLLYLGIRACCWNCSMIVRVCSNVGLWAMAMVSGDGSIGWSGSEAKVVDGVGSGTSIGSTCIGEGGCGCGAGAGGGSAATGGVAGVTGAVGMVGAAGGAMAVGEKMKNVGGS